MKSENQEGSISKKERGSFKREKNGMILTTDSVRQSRCQKTSPSSKKKTKNGRKHKYKLMLVKIIYTVY